MYDEIIQYCKQLSPRFDERGRWRSREYPSAPATELPLLVEALEAVPPEKIPDEYRAEFRRNRTIIVSRRNRRTGDIDASVSTGVENEWVLAARRLSKLLPSVEPTSPDPLRLPSAEQLLAICAVGEDQLHEFKQPDPDVRKVTREIAAMLNTSRGGMILYGVANAGAVCGADLPRQEWEERVQDSVRNTIKPSAAITIGSVEVSGKHVLVAIVPPWDRKTVYYYVGRVKIRRGTSVFDATPGEIKKLHLGQCIV